MAIAWNPRIVASRAAAAVPEPSTSLLLALGLTTRSATDAYRVSSQVEALQNEVHETLSFIANRLSEAGLADLTPSPVSPLLVWTR